jgi:hypothetical protein
MAIDTISCGCIARCDSFSVHTRLVLGILIDPLLGPEFVNQVRVAMAPGTELWHLRTFDFSEKSTFGTHGTVGVVQTRISAVTVRTSEAPMLVHVCAKGLNRGPQIAVERRVTLDTGILGLKVNRRKNPQQEDDDRIASEASHR